MLEIKDNGDFLEIYIDAKKIGLASRTRPFAHIVRGIHHLLAQYDIDFELIEKEVRAVLATKGK